MDNKDNLDPKETQAEAKRRQREIKRQKEAGTYVPSLLERAKDRLRLMNDPSLE